MTAAPSLRQRADDLRWFVLLPRTGPTVNRLLEEAEADPAALALALVLDVPRRVTRLARGPLPTWAGALGLAVLVWRGR